jgi:hypothetical protein
VLVLTRRAFLSSSGFAVVGYHRPLLFGSNNPACREMHAAGIHVTACRTYLTYMPAAWPGDEVPAGVTAITSFEPGPSVMTGGQDAHALERFLPTVPDGTWLTAWHEGNLKGGFWGDARQFRRMHHLIHRKVRRLARPRVRYGVILSSWPVYSRQHQDVTRWVPAGMDFAAMDGYQRTSDLTPRQIFGPVIAGIRRADKHVPLGITETNTWSHYPSARTWYHDTFEYALDHGMIVYSTFWRTHVRSGSGLCPAFHADAAYVPQLRRAARYAAQLG